MAAELLFRPLLLLPTQALPPPAPCRRVPPLPPLVNASAPVEKEGFEGDGEADASVSVVPRTAGAKGGGGGGREAAGGKAGLAAGAAAGGAGIAVAPLVPEESEDDGVVFAWEEVDPRFDKATRAWRSPQKA